jgi:hypothetical protein
MGQAGRRIASNCTRNSPCSTTSGIKGKIFEYRSASRHNTKRWATFSGSTTKRSITSLSETHHSLNLSPEHSVGNTVRKVLHHIREEYHTATQGEVASSSSAGKFSIAKFVRQGQPRKQVTVVKSETKPAFKENDPDDPDSFARGLKPVLMEAIQDVFDELETVYDNISKNAKDHVHSECVHPCSGFHSSLRPRCQRNHPHPRCFKNGRIFPESRCTPSKLYCDSRRNSSVVRLKH